MHDISTVYRGRVSYIIQIYILHRYIGKVLVKSFSSGGGGHYIWIFLFLLLETSNARREMRILLVVFFHCWQRYAVCFFTVSFHKSHFAEENEMPMEITLFKSNTVRWEVVFEISRETVTIEWKRKHWFKLNVVDHYVNYTKLLLLSKLQSSKTSTPMNTVTFVSNKLLFAMCENNIMVFEIFKRAYYYATRCLVMQSVYKQLIQSFTNRWL
jgi:hypothetical protein